MQKEILGFERADLEFLQILIKASSEQSRQILLTQNLDLLTPRLGQAIQWLTAQVIAEDDPIAIDISIRIIENIVFEISNFALGDRAQHIEIVLAGYTAMLTAYPQDHQPEEWARIQNNLAGVYWQRLNGDHATNIEQAIACYQAALTIRQAQAFPLDCLNTACNLGNLAYAENNWTLALQAYECAIQAMEILWRWPVKDKKRLGIWQNAINIYERASTAAFNAGWLEQAIQYAKNSRRTPYLNLMVGNHAKHDTPIPCEVQSYLYSRYS